MIGLCTFVRSVLCNAAIFIFFVFIFIFIFLFFNFLPELINNFNNFNNFSSFVFFAVSLLFLYCFFTVSLFQDTNQRFGVMLEEHACLPFWI